MSDRIILGSYMGIFLGGVYINSKITEHEKKILELRQVNQDMWTIKI